MSGTRKMEKFELDAYTKAREEELVEKGGHAGAVERPLETQAAAAIAELQPGALLDALEPNANLPARTFEPRTAGAAGADLPAVPFERRPASGGPGPADLPALPFEPRGASGAEPPDADRPVTPDGAWVPGEWVPPQAPAAESSPGEAAPDPEALRTRLARKFVTLADSFTEAFRELAIGAGAYAIELTAPQGMSTGGGKQALQHIRLRPRREGYSVVVAGTVNQVERRAELRDYDHIAVVNEVRFRQPVDINRQEWEQFLRRAEVVLNDAGIQSMRTPPTRELLDQRRSMQRLSKKGIITLLVVLVLASLVVWRVVVALRAGG